MAKPAAKGSGRAAKKPAGAKKAPQEPKKTKTQEARAAAAQAKAELENDDGLSLNGSPFHYLADLVLRSGQTYLGDVVAMGGRPVGRGVGGNRALVHKVEPGASSQVVLIVDWGVEEDA